MNEAAELAVRQMPGPGLAGLPAGARILVMRLRSMGDTVLMTPALRLLHDWRPDLRISVLVQPPWDQLLEANPAVDSVIVLRGKVSTAWRIRRARFRAVINLHGGPTSLLLTRLSGARYRAGFAHYRSATAYNWRVPTAQEILGRSGPVHTAEHAASCFFWLGVPPAEIPPAEVYPAAPAAESVRRKLQTAGLAEGEGYAILHPAALYASKQWKARGFAELGQYLARRFALRPVYVCAQEEDGLLDQMQSCRPGPLLRAVGWPIRELVALIAGARIFIGNDSGPAHIAAAARIPVLVIFGSSDAAVWGPWKAVGAAVVQNDFDCNPCAGDRCYVYDEPRCILSVSSEQVRVCLQGLLRSCSPARI